MFRRPIVRTLLGRIRERRRFIVALAGPRQSGKTTIVHQAIQGAGLSHHYASADSPVPLDHAWIEQQWDIARRRTNATASTRGILLVMDEIQKIAGWSESVKRLWDEDTRSGIAVKIVLLGSSPWLIQRGLTESLAGRFELLHVPHWSYDEMRSAFGWDVERYVFFGGYPGSAALIRDERRWARYILDSIVEMTLARDILLMTRVDKPALLRRLFHLACAFSSQILSYQKMVGQLHDAGNTTTLAHYLELLAGAGMAAGISGYSGTRARQRATSPKLQVLNTALAAAMSGLSFGDIRKDPALRGRMIESTVGAHLLNSAKGTTIEVDYWRDRNFEVDFVLRAGKTLLPIEVKSGRQRDTFPGCDAFEKTYRTKRRLIVGEGYIPLEEFLLQPAAYWIG